MVPQKLNQAQSGVLPRVPYCWTEHFHMQIECTSLQAFSRISIHPQPHEMLLLYYYYDDDFTGKGIKALQYSDSAPVAEQGTVASAF